MGTLHAWESFGDNTPPDIQAIAKGLGGGFVVSSLPFVTQANLAVDMLLLVPF